MITTRAKLVSEGLWFDLLWQGFGSPFPRFGMILQEHHAQAIFAATSQILDACVHA